MSDIQTGILAPLPALGRYLSFSAGPQGDPRAALRALGELADGQRVVVGLGKSLLRALGRDIPGLHSFAGAVGPGLELPATPAALWCWLRGDDRGELLHRSRELIAALAPALRLVQASDAFRYREGRDLTGYEDGTENPVGEEAVAAAITADGGSFAAVQHWVHDLDHFQRMPQAEQDDIIGRRQSDNAELEDAPASAHVKRTAQESFAPEAFVVRRSMPFSDGEQAGLLFLAFGHSLDAFEAQLKRMAGLEDGIVDALFRFSRPTSGGYYWCPPLQDGRLDLRVVLG